MITELSSTSGRNFRGALGLRPGFDCSQDIAANTGTREEIFLCWERWSQHRFDQGKPYLGIVVGPVEELLYGFKEDGKLVHRREPVVMIHGEIGSYHDNLNDDEVVETLRSLFEHLGSVFKQTTVRFLFHGSQGSRTSYRLRFPDTEHPLD